MATRKSIEHARELRHSMTMQRRYKAVRGSYRNTPDDRMDRWYIDDRDSSIVDRRGPGFPTKRDCERAIRYLEEEV